MEILAFADSRKERLDRVCYLFLIQQSCMHGSDQDSCMACVWHWRSC